MNLENRITVINKHKEDHIYCGRGSALGNPFIMNDESEGQTVALAGKVPCRVQGTVSKGDLLTTSGAKVGCAKKAFSPKVGSIIGKAMENKNDAGESLILISVGRQ